MQLNIAVSGPVKQAQPQAAAEFKRILEVIRHSGAIQAEGIHVYSQGAPNFDQDASKHARDLGCTSKFVNFSPPHGRSSYRAAALRVSAYSDLLIVATDFKRAGPHWTVDNAHGSDFAIVLALKHAVRVLWIDTNTCCEKPRWLDLDVGSFTCYMQLSPSAAREYVRGICPTAADGEIIDFVKSAVECRRRMEEVESSLKKSPLAVAKWTAGVWDAVYKHVFNVHSSVEHDVDRYCQDARKSSSLVELMLPPLQESARGIDLLVRNRSQERATSSQAGSSKANSGPIEKLIKDFENARKQKKDGDADSLSGRSNHLQGLHRFSFVCVTFLLLASALSQQANHSVPAVALLVTAGLIYAKARTSRWQELATDTRLASELLRHAPVAIAAGMDPFEVEDNMLHYREQDPRKQWIIAKYRKECVGLYTDPNLTSTSLQAMPVRDVKAQVNPWFDVQIKWLRGTALSYRFSATLAEYAGRTLFFLALLAFGTSLFTEPSSALVLRTIYVVASLVSVAIFSLASQSEVARLASRYSSLAEVLQRHKNQINALPDTASLQDIQPILRSAVRAAISEALEWRILHRYHPIHSPG